MLGDDIVQVLDGIFVCESAAGSPPALHVPPLEGTEPAPFEPVPAHPVPRWHFSFLQNGPDQANVCAAVSPTWGDGSFSWCAVC